MSIRVSFNTAQRNEPPQMTIKRSPQLATQLSNLTMFKAISKEPPKNERDINRRKKVEEVLTELDALVGLESVKKLVWEIQAFVQIQNKREKENLITEPMVLHMIFKGKPLTTPGKTILQKEQYPQPCLPV